MSSVSSCGDTERLLALGSGFQVSSIIYVSIRLGLFEALGDKTVSLKVLAQKLNVSAKALCRLLRVLQGLRLVSKKGKFYENSPIARKHLRANGSENFSEIFRHLETLQGSWSTLGSVLKKNKMVMPRRATLAEYPRQLKKYLAAMHALGSMKSAQIKKLFPVKRYRHMLDVGGGKGTYAVSFAGANKKLAVTVFDLKTVVPHTQRFIRASGLGHRIRVIAGECLTTAFPEGPFDLIFISNLLHLYPPGDCRKIIRKAVRVLANKGILLIHDYIIGCGDPVAVSLFDMTMLVGTPEGRCHTKDELAKWMVSAGLTDINKAVVGTGTSIIWGAKTVGIKS